jgi:hypothetical protein
MQPGDSRVTYVTLAGIVVLLVFALVQWLGQMRRTLTASRPYRHRGDADWECSTERRLRLRR